MSSHCCVRVPQGARCCTRTVKVLRLSAELEGWVAWWTWPSQPNRIYAVHWQRLRCWYSTTRVARSMRQMLQASNSTGWARSKNCKTSTTHMDLGRSLPCRETFKSWLGGKSDVTNVTSCNKFKFEACSSQDVQGSSGSSSSSSSSSSLDQQVTLVPCPSCTAQVNLVTLVTLDAVTNCLFSSPRNEWCHFYALWWQFWTTFFGWNSQALAWNSPALRHETARKMERFKMESVRS